MLLLPRVAQSPTMWSAAAACAVRLRAAAPLQPPVTMTGGQPTLSLATSHWPQQSLSVRDRSLLDRILQDERLEKWAAVTRSLQACLQHVGPWSLGDLAFGLKAVAEQHSRDGIEDSIKGKAITDKAFVERLLEEVWIAEAVHRDTADAMADVCCLERSQILTFDAEAHHFKPAFALAIWPSRKQVVLVVRGTTSLADALTDLTGHLEPFDGTASSAFLKPEPDDGDSSDAAGSIAASAEESQDAVEKKLGGHCHHGIAKAAMALLDSQAEAIAAALRDHPGYGLTLLGHSLGAGTAAIAAILIRNSPEVAKRIGTNDVTCVAFAPPPILTRDLALSCSSYVQSVVNRHDVVPRASLASFERLRQEMLATRWEDRFHSEFKSSKPVELALKARSSLDETLVEVGITEQSEKASRALASAWAGAKAAIQSRLGGDRSESAIVGAAMGASVDAARSATEAAEGSSQGTANRDSSRSKSGMDSSKDQAGIPHLYAPGEMLYLCSSEGSNGDRLQLLKADPPDQRFSRIVLCSDMVTHHRATSYIRALEEIAQDVGSTVSPRLRP